MQELLDEDRKVLAPNAHLRERWKIAGMWLVGLVLLTLAMLFGAWWMVGPDRLGEGWWYPLATYGFGGLWGVAAAMLVFYASLPRDTRDNKEGHGPVAAPFLFSTLAGLVVFFAVSTVMELVLQVGATT